MGKEKCGELGAQAAFSHTVCPLNRASKVRFQNGFSSLRGSHQASTNAKKETPPNGEVSLLELASGTAALPPIDLPSLAAWGQTAFLRTVCPLN